MHWRWRGKEDEVREADSNIPSTEALYNGGSQSVCTHHRLMGRGLGSCLANNEGGRRGVHVWSRWLKCPLKGIQNRDFTGPFTQTICLVPVCWCFSITGYDGANTPNTSKPVNLTRTPSTRSQAVNFHCLQTLMPLIIRPLPELTSLVSLFHKESWLLRTPGWGPNATRGTTRLGTRCH